MVKKEIGLTDSEEFNLCGPSEKNIDAIEQLLHCTISYRNGLMTVSAGNPDDENKIMGLLTALVSLAQEGRIIERQDIVSGIQMMDEDGGVDFHRLYDVSIGRSANGRTIMPKTLGQYHFVKAMSENDIVFATGPAGTGKTFLAVIYAVSCLKKGEVKRIVLTRPAVEAGESLGFLPGDLKEKVDPYLTPLYDALHVMLGTEATERMIEKGIIEIAPLAYMRGRTLDDAFVILDEAQNTTIAQMKMFLTRLGFHSHMVIAGDVTQVDLDHHHESGLVQAVRILQGLDGIAIVNMTVRDVVRNPLVQKIIERYEQAGKNKTGL